jgi:hypothetical protein
MRRQLANAVRKEFDVCLRRNLSKFRPVKPREVEFLGRMEKEIPPGDRLYLWDFKKDLYFYLMLVIATPKMGDGFTVEGAWTQNGKFPSTLFPMAPRGIPKSDILPDKPENGDMRFRIGDLLPEPEPQEDLWWWVAPRPSFEEFNKWLLEGDFEGEKLFGPKEMPVEEATKNVKPCVEDAVRHIVKYVMPYFEEIIGEYKNETTRTL